MDRPPIEAWDSEVCMVGSKVDHLLLYIRRLEAAIVDWGTATGEWKDKNDRLREIAAQVVKATKESE